MSIPYFKLFKNSHLTLGFRSHLLSRKPEVDFALGKVALHVFSRLTSLLGLHLYISSTWTFFVVAAVYPAPPYYGFHVLSPFLQCLSPLLLSATGLANIHLPFHSLCKPTTIALSPSGAFPSSYLPPL